MTDEERKSNIMKVYSKLGWSSDQYKGFYESDTTEEADTTEQAAASTPKDAIGIDSEYDKDNDGEDEDDINANAPDGGVSALASPKTDR